MSKNNKSSNKIIRKLTSRYRMLVVNEETFEEQFQFRLSRLNVIIVSIFLFSIFSVGIFFTIAYTPLREYIPGYDSSKIRKNDKTPGYFIRRLSIDYGIDIIINNNCAKLYIDSIISNFV